MCQLEHKVYTVCTHVYEHAVPCTLTSRTRARCDNPEVITSAKFGFCRECRDFYAPLVTDSPYIILSYWAYKAERGINYAMLFILRMSLGLSFSGYLVTLLKSIGSVFTLPVMIFPPWPRSFLATEERHGMSILSAFSISATLHWSGLGEGAGSGLRVRRLSTRRLRTPPQDRV